MSYVLGPMLYVLWPDCILHETLSYRLIISCMIVGILSDGQSLQITVGCTQPNAIWRGCVNKEYPLWLKLKRTIKILKRGQKRTRFCTQKKGVQSLQITACGTWPNAWGEVAWTRNINKTRGSKKDWDNHDHCQGHRKCLLDMVKSCHGHSLGHGI